MLSVYRRGEAVFMMALYERFNDFSMDVQELLYQMFMESYSQQMTEMYVGEKEQPQLDLEVWVAASGGPKKGHVYGFGHNMDTSRVLSGASSSGS
ncbi:hypothetical protein Taro_033913 [Colocasia esculenta]|uniref:Uncharacterized protein n=1 Tax=Colocasia esculenta TaxID=4460 RepID=A0A843W641_COLES|nr:hypothetical protein [Colocasia esculenta]